MRRLTQHAGTTGLKVSWSSRQAGDRLLWAYTQHPAPSVHLVHITTTRRVNKQLSSWSNHASTAPGADPHQQASGGTAQLIRALFTSSSPGQQQDVHTLTTPLSLGCSVGVMHTVRRTSGPMAASAAVTSSRRCSQPQAGCHAPPAGHGDEQRH